MSESHWYTSSMLNWNVDTSLTKCLRRQKRLDNENKSYRSKGCGIWKVPGSVESHYPIRNYAPVVDGVEFIGDEVY